jgi:hypothetical protein
MYPACCRCGSGSRSLAFILNANSMKSGRHFFFGLIITVVAQFLFKKKICIVVSRFFGSGYFTVLVIHIGIKKPKKLYYSPGFS